jgi:hypothetical protein
MQPAFETICIRCKHFKVAREELKFVCDAFPKGIPYIFMSGKYIHDKPFRGDKGIQFEERTWEDVMDF